MSMENIRLNANRKLGHGRTNMQQLMEAGFRLSRWVRGFNRLALLAALPILFGSSSDQHREHARVAPRILSPSMTATARPLPLPATVVHAEPVASGAIHCQDS